MEDEEDTYGFGSFSELFDAGASQAQKRLDLGALSRFCMSERLLSRFQQQQRQDKRCAVFQHVAAKFNGVGIDGGLGALSVAALEGGGVVWLQTAQSDSDALERRKKELQDITNRAPQETKSAAALFVAVELVAEVLPTTVQNTVQGVEMKLSDGNRLELTFMPGPFAGVAHRDEFLQTLKKLMADGKEEASAEHAAAIPAESESAKEEVGGGDLQSQVDSEASDAAQREKFRQLVRRYTTVDPLSDEGIAIAKQVHAGTGYHLGPMAKQIPKFSADSEYRKKTVAELSSYLNRMNQEWGEADSHRELHTKAKHSRNDDDLFEYTDTDTGAQIPARAYEQRYLEYAKAHEVNPVLHLCPDQGEKMKRDTTALNGALDAHHSAPTTSSTVAEEEARNDREACGWMLERAMATPRQVSATVDRLLQWKKRNDAKREVRAKLQEDERVEEEEYYLSLSKALPQNRVEAAAIRNYRAAGELRWKKQMLQAIAEQQQLEEEAECAFRPRLEARPRQSARSIETKSTCCRPSCAAAAARADLGKVPPCRYRQAATEVKEDVFERLYKPHAESAADVATAAPQHITVVKQISIETETAFVTRQEHDQIDRPVNFNLLYAAVQ
ncbi:hypothetical protein PR002_g9401 [Phytophthora rubi]|uniref:Uncharacterized protein n=1 Tax=Phytophthora rubi TaxID=129364 RepID=A0A6A3MRX0_9STRA|nr:hypothetical protein PR002_g9401 [Phytophthora rubi]